MTNEFDLKNTKKKDSLINKRRKYLVNYRWIHFFDEITYGNLMKCFLLYKIQQNNDQLTASTEWLHSLFQKKKFFYFWDSLKNCLHYLADSNLVATNLEISHTILKISPEIFKKTRCSSWELYFLILQQSNSYDKNMLAVFLSKGTTFVNDFMCYNITLSLVSLPNQLYN